MLENKFKTGLVKELKERFPGCMVVHLDPNEIQGIPDLLVLHEDTWAALEGKKSAKAYAAAPKVPIPYGDGSEDMGSNIPLLLFIFFTS